MGFLVETIQNFNRSDIVVFFRDESGKKHKKIITTFKPYFYVDEDATVPDDYRIVQVEKGHTNILGSPVKKIIVRKSTDVSKVRELFPKHYEADIMFANRYIIDVLGEQKQYPLKILSLDIETDSLNEFPDMDTANQIITSISLTDSFSNKTITLFYKSPECTEKVEQTEEIRVFHTEADMLNALIVWMKKLEPDVLTGWNLEGFDLPYLFKRMTVLEINPQQLSPLNNVYINDKFEDVTIKGMIVLDYMNAYKLFRGITNQGRAESYSLEFTSQSELGTGKLPHDNYFHDMWVHEPNKLIKYNRKDTELVIELEKKLKIIEFYNLIRCLTCSNLKDIYKTTTIVDGLLLRKVHNKIVLPSRYKQEGETYSGAFVYEPTPGVYTEVIALDVKGMYPNIIKTFNIGYETFNPEGEIQIEEKKGIGFNAGVGLMSQTVRDLETERAKFKKLMKSAKTDNDRNFYHFRQYAIKVLANSIYGYLGAPNSRLYRKEVANAITTMGRKVIKWTQTVLKNLNYQILYGDTDSTYIKARNTGLLNILLEGKKLTHIINESYKELAHNCGATESTLEIEFEKIYTKIIFVAKKGADGKGAKKRYAYITLWEDGKDSKGKIEYTGFDAKRSDSSRLSRRLQEQVLQMILTDKSKDEVLNYLKEIDRKIRNSETPAEEYAFPKGISMNLYEYGVTKEDEEGNSRKTGTPPVVRGCRYSNKYLGTRFSKGSKPKWMYVKSVPKGYPETDVISFEHELPDGFVPDYDIMIDKGINKKIESIFESAGFGKLPKLDSTQQTLF